MASITREPGVYLQTLPRQQAVSGALSSSGLALVGAFPKGPINTATVVTSWTQFEETFGTFDATLKGPMAAWVFFQNGGSRLVIVRVTAADAVQAVNYISTEVSELIHTGDGSDTTATATLQTPVEPGSISIVYKRGVVVAAEVLDASAGGDTSYTGVLAHFPLSANLVVVSWTAAVGGAKSQTIDADGVATGAGNPGSTTLDRTTGALNLDMDGDTPAIGTAIRVAYVYYGPAVTVTDDGAGALQSGATGTINYATGALAITFSDAPALDYAVSAVYDMRLFTFTMDHPGAYGNDVRLSLSGCPGYEDDTIASYTRWNLSVEVLDANGTFSAAETWTELSLTDNTDPSIYIVDALNDVTAGSDYFTVVENNTGSPASLSGVLQEDEVMVDDDGDVLEGDGAETDFAAVAAGGTIHPTTLTITSVKSSDDSTMTLTDDGDGALTGDGTGTVDYLTGEISILWESAVKSGEMLVANYYTSPTFTIASPYRTQFTGGADGSALVAADVIGSALEADRVGVYATARMNEMLMLILPDFCGIRAVAQSLVDYCASREDRFAIICPPAEYTPAQAVSFKKQMNRPAAASAAIYYPWLYVTNPATERSEAFPPVFHVAGVIARTDTNRSVAKAPAGQDDGRLVYLISLQYELENSERGTLRDHQINSIVQMPHFSAPAVFGANTLERGGDYKYVQVTRMKQYIALTVERMMYLRVFEPNTPNLRSDIALQVSSFMARLFSSGWFAGSAPADGFRVICDDTNNTPATIAAGQLYVRVLFAPTTPAEFIIVQIGQMQGA